MLDRGSVRLFTYKDIPVRLHWSFGLLLVWIWYIGMRSGMDWSGIGVLGLLMLCLFVCVIMHEFGHALAARRYGVHTRDIILSPIGGMARLDHLPEKPQHELIVALAGPAVNVVIAAVLGLVAWLWLPAQWRILGESESDVFQLINFVPLLFWMNVMLVFFNMIPAFPMDGGRVLRAFLAWRIGRLRATHYASIVGRVLATGFVLLAIWQSHVFLGLIGVFVFVMAGQEYKMVKAEQLYRQFLSGDVTRRYQHLVPSQAPVAEVLRGIQADLAVNVPVGTIPGSPEGYVSARDLYKAMRQGHNQSPVAHFIRPFHRSVGVDVPLTVLFSYFQQSKDAVLLVTDYEGRALGLIDRDQIDHVLYWANRYGKLVDG
jgi:Zn-dependent protease